MNQFVNTAAADVNVIIEDTTFTHETVAHGDTTAMPDVVDSASSDKSFSRESTPNSLSEEAPSVTDGSAEAFRSGESNSPSALPVPLFRPKGRVTVPTTTKPNKPSKPNGGR